MAGSSTGIERVEVGGLAEAGATVILRGRTRDGVHPAVDAMRGLGVPAADIVVEVRSRDDVQCLVETTSERFGGVDILINQAGIQRYGAVVETDEATRDEVMGVNLKRVRPIARAAIRLMRERIGGIIVNGFGAQGLGVADYGTSQAVVNGLMQPWRPTAQTRTFMSWLCARPRRHDLPTRSKATAAAAIAASCAHRAAGGALRSGRRSISAASAIHDRDRT
ncbi:MAG: SDR family NAD(P)-dependent oxidoreductase [Thermomicrobiales bacterium]|nr:SDR family NAD(P)-dependent oxidoreductase [Thermomicrobiales bacterium]